MAVDTATRAAAGNPGLAPTPTRGRQPRSGMVGSSHGGHWWLYLVLVVAFVAVVAPFIWMVLGSFKSEGELRQVPPTWLPETASLDNYTQLFDKLNFGQFFSNSIVVAVVVTAGNLVFCSMLGYALAMLDFRGKRAIFVAVMGTLMIPGVVTFVPLFVLVANAGLIDTLPGLFLPFLVSPFGVFLMRQFILGLPKDLLDAGRVEQVLGEVVGNADDLLQNGRTGAQPILLFPLRAEDCRESQ